MGVKTCRSFLILFALGLALFVAGCATMKPALPPEVPAMHRAEEFADDEWIEYPHDPWERFNRSMYRFNYNLDRYVLLPVVTGYEFITPAIVQTGVSNFFNNIYEVRTLYNSLLQLKGKKALTTFGRFVTNSTIGIGGLFDVATTFGMKRRQGDFGQTLGVWGVGAGPYFVLPLLGPNTASSAVGYAVDGGIRYAALTATKPFDDMNYRDGIQTGIWVLEATNLRHVQKFRYYGSGYPFEYDVVRFLYVKSRELMITK